jgi:hypothetical protein
MADREKLDVLPSTVVRFRTKIGEFPLFHGGNTGSNPVGDAK